VEISDKNLRRWAPGAQRGSLALDVLEDDGCDRDGKFSQKPWENFVWIHIPEDP